MAERQNQQPPSGSRRSFLKYTGTAIGGVVVGGVIGGAIAGGFRKKTETPAPETPAAPAPASVDFNQAPMFMTQQQLQIAEAATERIFPKDELGPGAAELGVAFYIDHQLASPWGVNAHEYRMGPFVKGEATQGDYQSIARHELITMGFQALEEESKKKYQNKSFIELADAEKDAILTSMEKGEIMVVNGITGKTFFNLLRQLTLEGVYSDPLYGGNKNMQGWKMRKYPGNQMSYSNIMEKDEFVAMEPRSLHDHFAH
ncbi:gluconate 2-dehydrogenase subunit 3 family protein [Paenibacillus thalictri]|uniref:Gluconate 2-dehydrogenase subunit 3 family protein n=1 Tax=Paenibacillus thalictri TaxID=2527873 RepID=A0A4Q9DJ11_9BACL|nr:gluconate 2-dehydrogenase subunit 3 family protein [Paenibacillus thalictri]TBL72715.1 gluconate 2-dehydrogenase subunit 3 family protein [Paenibacillus thalictri]